MEITKSPDGFKPFFIRIDSKTEADFLWAMLDSDTEKSFNKYLQEEKLEQYTQEYAKHRTLFFQRLQKQIKKQILIKEAEKK